MYRSDNIVLERVIKPAIVDVLWESEYYNGVNKDNRYSIGLNPKIGDSIERKADKIIDALKAVGAFS